MTLGLAIQAWATLTRAFPEERERYEQEAGRLVHRLHGLTTPGWSGACWGYDFDWESRDTSMPAGTPTVVATGFVTNGLFAAHEIMASPGAIELCDSACAFIRRDLNRTPGSNGSFCWSYSPFDSSCVLNATAKGSRLLAQVGHARGIDEYFAEARRSLEYVVRHQRADGSWPYAIGDPRSWADNFHTAYVLDALVEYRDRSGDETFSAHLEEGWNYYRTHFFEDGWLPRYYDSSLYPIDATAVGQSMLTLCRFGDVHTAARIATMDH